MPRPMLIQAARRRGQSSSPTSLKVAGPYPWSAGFQTLADEYDYRIDEIDGVVPKFLRGTLFRNGSGRNDLDGAWFPNWLDGDGMI